MTREEAKNAAEVMLAYAEGKDIENKLKGNNLWWLIPGVDKERTLSFDFDRYDYRIKSEPTYRPFENWKEYWNELHNHMPFGFIIHKDNRRCYKIEGTMPCNGNEIAFIQLDNDDMYSLIDIFRIFTFADGTPFGIKEE